jgi:hypothetical protein
MSDNDREASGLTLEVLASEIANLKAKSACQEAEISRLRGQSAQAATADRSTSSVPEPGSPTPLDSDGTSGPLGDHPVSRRGALRALGGVAAGGVGLALGSTVLAAQPAAAADGSNLVLGSGTLNTAATPTTLLGSVASGALLNIENASSSGASSGLYALKGDSGSGITGVVGAVVGDISSGSLSGVVGLNDVGSGVTGQSQTESGVAGSSHSGIGVFGVSPNGIGVLGQGGTYGLVGEGTLAPLVLSTASGSVGPPTTGSHFAGEFFVDHFGALFYCYSANKWVQIDKGFTNLLPTPIRVFDSRVTGAPNVSDPSRAAGPLAAQAIVTLQITGASVGGHSVPAGAAAVIGNVTAVSPTADGWLTLYPNGEATPLVSNLNFQVGDKARGNFCVVALDGTGKMDVFAQSSTQVVFDVTGFVF